MSKHNPPDLPDLMRRAECGDRAALWRLYGMAAAWLRNGKAPPAPLDEWIARRLDSLSTLLRQHEAKQDAARTLRDKVLHIFQPARSGRPPRKQTVLMARAMADEAESRALTTGKMAPAARQVAARHTKSTKTIEAAVSKSRRR